MDGKVFRWIAVRSTIELQSDWAIGKMNQTIRSLIIILLVILLLIVSLMIVLIYYFFN